MQDLYRRHEEESQSLMEKFLNEDAPQWSLQNRPYVVTSKPAMGRFPGT